MNTARALDESATVGWLRALSIVVTSAGVVPCAHADQWTIDAQASERLVMDSNVRLSPVDPQPVFGSSTSLQSTVGYATPRATVDLTGAATIRRYINDSASNGEDLSLGVRSEYRFIRSSVGVALAVRRASTLFTEELDSGDFSRNAVQYSVLVQPTWQYRLTELDSVSVTGGWSARMFESGGFADSQSFNFGASWLRHLSPVDTISLGLRAAFIRSEAVDQLSQTQSYSVILGWSRKFSERLSFNAFAGPRVSITNLSNRGAGSNDNVDIGAHVNVQLAYSLSPLTTVSVGLSQDLEPASTGGVQERQRFSVGFAHKFTRRTSLSLSGSAQRNGFRIGGDNSSRESRFYLSSTAGLAYQVTPRLSASVQYMLRMRDPETGGSFVFSHAVAGVISYNMVGWRFRD